jgi:hypothetical protein
MSRSVRDTMRPRVILVALAFPPRPRMLPFLGKGRRSPCSWTKSLAALSRITLFGSMTALLANVAGEFMAETGAVMRDLRMEVRRIRSRA